MRLYFYQWLLLASHNVKPHQLSLTPSLLQNCYHVGDSQTLPDSAIYNFKADHLLLTNKQLPWYILPSQHNGLLHIPESKAKHHELKEFFLRI